MNDKRSNKVKFKDSLGIEESIEDERNNKVEDKSKPHVRLLVPLL